MGSRMKLIKLNEDHYIIVDDSEIKEGDLCYDPEGNPGHRGIKYVVKCLRTAPDSYWNKHCKKITHSTQPDKGMENVTFISPTEVKQYVCWLDETEWEVEFINGKLKLL